MKMDLNPVSLCQRVDQKTLKEWLHFDRESGVFRWSKSPNRRIKVMSMAGTVSGNGYRQVKLLGRFYMEHHLAWLMVYGVYPKFEIDHIDHNRANNSIDNLRDVEHFVNQQNRVTCQKNNRSGALGVNKRKSGRYAALINVGGDVKHLGTFDTANEARLVYLSEKRLNHIGCVV